MPNVVHLQVGAALEELLSEGVVTREQLFITTKLW
jgi:diketogulonate reductase-like aldo/keto reductase